jgi:hypothetical protein
VREKGLLDRGMRRKWRGPGCNTGGGGSKGSSSGTSDGRASGEWRGTAVLSAAQVGTGRAHGTLSRGRRLTSGTQAWVAVGRRGPLVWAQPEMNNTNFLYSTQFSIDLNLNRPIGSLPKLEKFQIKYCFEGFEIRNNFPYRNFLIFKTEFE